MKRFLALLCILACLCALCLPAAAAIDYTIRVKAPSSMKEVYLYMWNSMDESQKNAEWPGVKLTKKVDGWYEVKMSNDFYDRVIISNGVGGPGTQTKDIEVDALYDLWITVDASYNYGVAYSEKEAGKVEFAGPDYMSIVGMNIPGVADWSTNDPNGVMEEVKDLVYEKTIGLAKGTTMTFKFTGNGTWDLPYNMGGNVAGEQIPLNKSRDLVENGQDMTFTATKDMGLKITLNLTGMANGGKATFKLEEVDGVDIPEPPAPVEKDYFVAGEAGLCGSEWNNADEANKLTFNGDGTYTLTLANIAAGTYKFKVTDGTWDNCWGDPNSGDVDGNYVLTVEKTGNVIITFNESTKTITTEVVDAPVVTEPSTEATEPSEPSVPSEPETEPSVAPTEPSVAPTEPSVAPTEPEGSQPDSGATEPSIAPSEPATEAPSEPLNKAEDKPEEKSNDGLWIALLSVAIVAVGALDVFLIIKRKKK